jgi:hypothetical protein
MGSKVEQRGAKCKSSHVQGRLFLVCSYSNGFIETLH